MLRSLRCSAFLCERRMVFLAVSLTVSSAILLVVSALGEFGLAFRADGRGDVAEKATAGKGNVKSLRRFVALLPPIVPGSEEVFFIALNRQLADRFHHGKGRFSIWSNWLFWLTAPCCRRLELIENTAHLFRYSREALCHQIAQAFVDVTTLFGYKARVVALDGHVVAEAFYDDLWHGFDPDYGVAFRSGGRILSVRQLTTAPEIAAGVYSRHRLAKSSDGVLAILRRNYVTPLPPGKHLSPRTAKIQRWLHWLRWGLPTVGMAAGIALRGWGT